MLRWTLRIGLILLAFFLLLLAYVGGSLIRFSDVEDSDLRALVETTVPASDAWPEFQRMISSTRFTPEEDQGHIQMLYQGQPLDDAVVSAQLEKNAEALEAFQRVAEIGSLRIPLSAITMDGYLDAGYPVKLSRLILLEARRQAAAGRKGAAMDLLLRVAAMGEILRNSGGALLWSMIGEALRNIVYVEIVRFLWDHSPGCDLGLSTAQRLREIHRSDTYPLSFASEYLHTTAYVEKAVLDESTDDLGVLLPLKFACVRRQARQSLADLVRRIVKVSDGPYHRVAGLTDPPLYSPEGMPMLLMGAPGIWLYRDYLARGFRMDAGMDLLRLGFAAVCFKERRGEFPERLEDLVPEFIPAVPLDPFDGAPMRYDPARETVHSLGADLVDEGGKPCGRACHNLIADSSEPTLCFRRPEMEEKEIPAAESR